jgi:glycosyltransferase involved in cell wall biosynthesis
MPRWGWDIALEAFLRLAAEDARLQFFALGGHGSEPYVAEAHKRIRAEGLEHRIRIFDGHIPDRAVQELISVADVFTSLVRLNDMRSSSILEGAAAGATPVLNDLAEYREMERLGFQALFIEQLDVSAVVKAVRRAIQEPSLRTEIAAANQRYLEEHEDNENNMLRLLDLIASCPARTEERARPDISDALTVIDEIIGARKQLGIVSCLSRLRRGCRHPLRSARSAWQDLRVFSVSKPPLPGFKKLR